jgi:hypothetical protein
MTTVADPGTVLIGRVADIVAMPATPYPISPVPPKSTSSCDPATSIGYPAIHRPHPSADQSIPPSLSMLAAPATRGPRRARSLAIETAHNGFRLWARCRHGDRAIVVLRADPTISK